MILEEIAEYAKVRVQHDKKQVSLEEMRNNAEILNLKTVFSFEDALRKKGVSFICEIKKASPSKGIIDEKFDYLSIAKEYAHIGADAISVLTEPKYFKGDDRYLSEISSMVKTPTLRKDFIIDEYQIYQAKTLGASAVLLICELFEKEKLAEFIKIAESVGLSILVESHSEEELEKALFAEAKIFGVNNRNLRDFSVDMNTSIRLRKLVPKDAVFVSESGIKCASDIQKLREVGVDAVLIGETFMREQNKQHILSVLKGEIADDSN